MLKGPAINLSALSQRGGVSDSEDADVDGASAAQVASAAGVVQPTGSLDFLVEAPTPVSLEEAVKLGAVDHIFFNQVWFPRTFRQEPALFHPQIYNLLDGPDRYINVTVMRDGAKTTILRSFTTKRVAYGISRTVLYIGPNATKAKQSVGWVKHQIETNTKFCMAFGLNRGVPWSDEHICVLHGPEGHKCHIIGAGIESGLRGINIEDYRPDLIVIDDCISDENAATKEQREKLINLVLGAVKESLARPSESPDAKLVILNTPLDFEDLAAEAAKDPQFVSAAYGCWTRETADLPVEYQESSWPAAYPSEYLRNEKRAAIARNRYSIFAREKECLLITAEDCAFKREHLKFFGPGEDEAEPPRHEMVVHLAIDPVPPPSKGELERGLKDKDFEAFAVVGRWRNKYYVLEQTHNRGHDPNWTINEFFRLCMKWNPRKVIVEAIAYQAVLAWILRQAMQRVGRYWAVEEFKDKRKKYNRIVDGLSGVSSEGMFFVRKEQHTLISQFCHYPGKNPAGNKDDDIEAVAVATESLQRGFVGDAEDTHYELEEKLIPDLGEYRGAP